MSILDKRGKFVYAAGVVQKGFVTSLETDRGNKWLLNRELRTTGDEKPPGGSYLVGFTPDGLPPIKLVRDDERSRHGDLRGALYTHAVPLSHKMDLQHLKGKAPGQERIYLARLQVDARCGEPAERFLAIREVKPFWSLLKDGDVLTTVINLSGNATFGESPIIAKVNEDMVMERGIRFHGGASFLNSTNCPMYISEQDFLSLLDHPDPYKARFDYLSSRALKAGNNIYGMARIFIRVVKPTESGAEDVA